MAEGMGRERWAHTSVLCTLIANIHRDTKKHRSFTVDDFNPYAPRKGHRSRPVANGRDVIEVTPDNIGLMRAAFTGPVAARH